jgi:hypothetical protein
MAAIEPAAAIEPVDHVGASDLGLYAASAAAVLVTLTFVGAAVDCVLSWRSRRRQRAREAALEAPAAARLRAKLALKAGGSATDTEETLWRRTFGSIDHDESGLCDAEEWELAMRQLVSVADTSAKELERIFHAIDLDGHGLVTPQSLGEFVWPSDPGAAAGGGGGGGGGGAARSLRGCAGIRLCAGAQRRALAVVAPDHLALQRCVHRYPDARRRGRQQFGGG